MEYKKEHQEEIEGLFSKMIGKFPIKVGYIDMKKGYGIFAVEEIKKGSSIITETPLISNQLNNQFFRSKLYFNDILFEYNY